MNEFVINLIAGAAAGFSCDIGLFPLGNLNEYSLYLIVNTYNRNFRYNKIPIASTRRFHKSWWI